MKYISTRGNSNPINSTQAILTGLAPDGGLFLPESIPVLTPEELTGLLENGYQLTAETILGFYLTDYSPGELEKMLAQAYGEKFDTPEVTPLTLVRDNLAFLELWHGPTCAFKDLALQLLSYLLTSAARKNGLEKEVVLLVATSGDTGKAALEGFKNVPGTKVIVFYPEDGVSEIQKKQMVTQEGENTFVIGVRGNFDQAQTGVKTIFANRHLQNEMEQAGKSFSSANSINWGRLIPQVVYYFRAWSGLIKQGKLKPQESFNIVVPTGNFGNILAAYYSKKMGLPVNKLICASNSNNVLTEFIRTGVYDRKRSFYQTISPSMDILVSSNLERLLYDLTGHNPRAVSDYMEKLRVEGIYKLTNEQLIVLNEGFWADFVTEKETTGAIKEVFEEFNYLIDPHTAVGYKVYKDYLKETGDRRPTVIASTASPFKFNTGVARAVLGEQSTLDQDEFSLLKRLSAFTGVKIPQGLMGLEDKPVLHQRVVNPEEMEGTVREILGI